MFMLIYWLSRKIRGFSKLLRFMYGCDIPKSAFIEKNVTFNHNALGVVIHPNAIIETGAYIEHHVLLGQRGKEIKAPIIRKNVVIGAYAIILGGVEIGEGTVIGAGSIVLHDIPSHSIYYNERVETIKKNNKKLRTY